MKRLKIILCVISFGSLSTSTLGNLNENMFFKQLFGTSSLGTLLEFDATSMCCAVQMDHTPV